MATKKKGFITRMIEGPERSDTYARSTLPGNRWELGWSIFRDNMGKMVGVNLLMLLFMLPVLFIVLMRYMQVQYYATITPYSQNLGLGYPAFNIYPGLTESIYVQSNLYTLCFLPLAGIIASIGISGGMYVMRNMVWSEGVFVGSDFWAGVKKNFGIVVLSTLLYTVVLAFSIFTISYSNYLSAIQGGHWLLTVSNVFSYVMIALMSIIYLYMLSMGVTYKLKFFQLLRNAIIMTVALIPTNLFFALFAMISIVVMFIGSLGVTIGMMAFIFFGLSGAALIWTNYSQWTFDKFINDRVPGAIKNRGIYSKTPDDEEKDFSFERSTLGKRPVKPITDYDVEIVQIPTTFSREDLRRLEESKAAMRKISDEYVEDVLSGKITEKSIFDEVVEDTVDEAETTSDEDSDE